MSEVNKKKTFKTLCDMTYMLRIENNNENV